MKDLEPRPCKSSSVILSSVIGVAQKGGLAPVLLGDKPFYTEDESRYSRAVIYSNRTVNYMYLKIAFSPNSCLFKGSF